MPTRFLRLAGLVASVALIVGPAAAQYPLEWTRIFESSSGFTTAPSTDIDFNAAQPSIYVVKNSSFSNPDSTTLYAFMPDGSGVRWQRSFSSTMQNFPIPVPLRNGTIAIFLTSTDGYLYAINAMNGGILWSRDLRRPECATDEIIATPTVQLRAYSSNFDLPDDTVYIITRYGCSTTTANRVWALNASTGSMAWKDPSTGTPFSFNDGVYGGTYAMDFGSEGCYVDYDRNLLYCGTNQPSPGEATLWAIHSDTGRLAWAKDVGPVRNRPQLKPHSSELFVVNYLGTAFALDADHAGAKLWSYPVTSNATVVKNPWPEFRASWNNLLLVTDSHGVLHALQDQGTGATQLWATDAGGAFTTMPLSSPADGVVFVGMSNGTVHELSLQDGADYASVTLDPGSPVYDGTLDTNGSGVAVTRLTIATASALFRLDIPFPPGLHQ